MKKTMEAPPSKPAPKASKTWRGGAVYTEEDRKHVESPSSDDEWFMEILRSSERRQRSMDETPVEIIDRGRGPEIKGTRITVYTIWEYKKKSTEFVSLLLDISEEQVECARRYIAEHKDEVMRNYAKIMERINRGNPPEIQAKLDRIQAEARERYR